VTVSGLGETFSTHVLTMWKAPATGDAECVLPEGTVLVVDHDQLPSKPGFNCRAEDYEALLPIVVPEDGRSDPKFNGYYFVRCFEEVGRSLRLLPDVRRRPSHFAFGIRIAGRFAAACPCADQAVRKLPVALSAAGGG
jgi:hypothetical protein